MGPLTHRETRLDAYLNQKKDVKWSEEAENEYLESVKSRATEKVRALLLQAKRRSDEIVREAELHAQEITAQAEKRRRKSSKKHKRHLAMRNNAIRMSTMKPCGKVMRKFSKFLPKTNKF